MLNLNRRIKLNTHEEMITTAHEVATLSPCLKKKVGAVLASDHIMLATGYGGAAFNCQECVRKKYEWTQDGCWSIHAEMRALFSYFKMYGFKEILPSSLTMYVTHGPCDQCLKYLHYFGLKTVVYDVPYHTDYTKWSGLIRISRFLEDKTIQREV